VVFWSIACDSAGNVYGGTSDGSIYKSTDGGRQWNALPRKPTQKELLTVAINSQGHIITGTGGTMISPAQGPFRSTDGGASWETLPIFTSPVSLFDVLFPSAGTIYALTGRGLYRSTDDGHSWVNVWAYAGNNVARNSSGHLFIGTSVTSPGVFRSTDDGQTWTLLNEGLQNSAVWSVYIDPSDVMYAATDNGIFRSRNNGEWWELLTANFGAEDVRDVVVTRSGWIVAGTNLGRQFGIIRSTDAGSSWQPANTGIASLAIKSVASDSSGNIYAVGTYGGIWKSTDGGATWIQVHNLASLLSTVACNAESEIFVGDIYGVIYRSTNRGASWEESRLPQITPLPTIRSFAFSHDGLTYAATANGLYSSTDQGRTWQRITLAENVSDIRSVKHLSAGRILVGTNVGMFLSTDNGSSWSSAGLENEIVTSLEVSPRGFLFATTLYGGVYRSSLDGLAWVQRNYGLPRPVPSGPNIPIGNTTINSKGDLFVTASGSEVYCSKDNGDTWVPVKDGLSGVRINALTVTPGGVLFAGTERNSIYRTAQSSITVVDGLDAPLKGVAVVQNYPNPFNTNTNIVVLLPEVSQTTVTIFDLLGREIRTLYEKNSPPGVLSVSWDGRNSRGLQVGSGVYFCTVAAQGRSGRIFRGTIKILLMK